MKKILFFITIIGLVGCNEVKKGTAAKQLVQLKPRNVSAFSTLSSYETHPDTFALFFMPEVNELTWSSSLFPDGETYENKLKAIMENIISLSNKRDALDKEIFMLSSQVTPLDDQMVEMGCYDDPTIEGCDELDTQVITMNTQISEKTTLSSEYLKGIQQSLDKDINNPVNWQEYGGDAKAYEFDINETTGEVKILMPKLGPYDQKYSTKDGSIYDVVYRSSDYVTDVKILTFKLAEKGQDGKPTGAFYDFKLEKGNYLNKIRFKGDVHKIVNGLKFQQGICKFELPISSK